MTVRIDANPPGQLAAGLAGSMAQPQERGGLGGMQVQVRDELSVLTDAAEEISRELAHKVEEKSHGEREVEATPRLRVLTIREINAYLEQAKAGTDPEALALLARRMLQAGANPAQLARANGNPPTEQFLLLQFAREFGAAQGASPEALARIEEALEDLEGWFGKVIETNLATIAQAGNYGRDAQEVRSFQGSVQVVLGQPSLSQALQELLQLAGRTGARLENALMNLMGALGACLASANAAEKVLLETLVTDLYHLKALRTLLDDCHGLVARLRRGQEGEAGGPSRRRARDDDEEEGGEYERAR